MKPIIVGSEVVVVALVALIAWLAWNRQPPRITQTYYNQVNLFWSPACGCWTNATGAPVPRGVPAIVNGDVQGVPDSDLPRALHRAAPALYPAPAAAPAASASAALPQAFRAVPWINNGDFWLNVGGGLVPCIPHRDRDCPAPPATVTPPPVSVAEPPPLGLMLGGIGAITLLRRFR